MTEEPTLEEHDNDDRSGRRLARRGALTVAAGGLGVAALATFGRQSPESISGTAAAAPAPAARPAAQAGQPAPSRADLDIAAVAASLEVLAVNTYSAALNAAAAGALGEVPPAVTEYVTTARNQHQAHLDAWNGVLTAAGWPAVSGAPPGLEASVNEQFGMVTDVAGAAQLALMLEQVAAATYLDAIGKLESADAIALAGSIHPIDRQHISILLFALGMYPVPETFATTAMAFSGGPLPTPIMPR